MYKKFNITLQAPNGTTQLSLVLALSVSEFCSYIDGIRQVTEYMLDDSPRFTKESPWTSDDMLEVMSKYLHRIAEDTASCESFVGTYCFYDVAYDVDIGNFPSIQNFAQENIKI